jgi:tetratricopeptide (TPR) repeat protein
MGGSSNASENALQGRGKCSPRASELLRAVGFAVFSSLAAAAIFSQDGDVLANARKLASEGRTGAALEQFEAWLRAKPDDRAVIREAATLAFRERRWFESARLLDRYVALDPGEPSGWYDLGALRHNQCRFDLAVPVFRQLEALEAGDPALRARAEHRFLHGESARRLEHFSEAISELEIAVARAPDRVDYRTALAQALLDGGRFEAAVGEFSSVVAKDPSADNYYGLGAALAETGKVDEAMRALKEARRLRSRDPRTLLKLGTLASRTKDLRRAESYLIEAREAAPRNVDVHFALAQVQRLQGQVDEAQQTRTAAEELRKEADAATERGRVFTRAIVSTPEDAAAHFKHGLDLLEQGRFDDAQLVFQRLLSFDPKNELAILNLSSLLARQGDAVSALKELKKILEKDEGHEVANLHAARVRMGMRDWNGAREHLNKVVARHPGSRGAYELLAVISRTLGDQDGAARYEAILRDLPQVESRPGKD